MADNLQSLIRSLPDCFNGQAAAEFCTQVATEVKAQAGSLGDNSTFFDIASTFLDLGEGTKIYSVPKILEAANQLSAYGASLDPEQTYCRASEPRNRIIYLLGNLYGLVGARLAVNATLSAAEQQLGQDLADNAKVAFDYGKYLVIAAVIVVVGLAFIKGKS